MYKKDSSVKSVVQRPAARVMSLQNLPSFVVIIFLSVGLLLFGADKPEASLLLSVFILTISMLVVLFTEKLPVPKLVFFALICWLVFFGSSLFVGLVDGHADEYLMLLTSIAIFAFGVFIAFDKDRLQSTWKMLVIWFGLIAVFAFFQHILSPETLLGFKKPYGQGRLGGFFLSSNTAAAFLAMGTIVVSSHIYRLWLMLNSSANYRGSLVWFAFLKKSLFAITILVFLITCILLTGSRAGSAATFLGLTIFLLGAFFRAYKLKRPGNSGELLFFLTIVICLCFSLTLLWSISGELLATRYDLLGMSSEARLDMFKAMWVAYEQSPLIGHGLGSVDDTRTFGTTAENSSNVIGQHAAHNYILQWLVQVGWVGSIIMGTFLLYVIYSIFHGCLYARNYGTYLVAILGVASLILSHGLFDYALEIPVVMLTFSLLLGIGYGISIKFRPSEI